MAEGRDDYRAEHLREALAADERVSELGLGVVMEGGRLVVRGVVSTPERQAAVADVLHELAPGVEVDNETTVVTLDGSEEVEVL